MRSPTAICSAILRRRSFAPITVKPCSRVARKLSSEPVRTHVLDTSDSVNDAPARSVAPSMVSAPMADDDLHLIGPDEIAYRLDLTPAQLKITWTAVKPNLGDFGHDETDVVRIAREVLDKLPDEHAIRAIDIS